MKKNPFVLVLMLVLFALTGYGYPDQARYPLSYLLQTNTFTSKEGRFSFTPPKGFGKFKFAKRTNPTDAGNIEMNQYQQDLARSTCMAVYYDMPESLFQIKTIQKMLEDGRDVSLRNVKGILDKETAITVDGYPGLSVHAHIEYEGQTIYARYDFIVAKPRIYNYLFLSLDESDLYRADVKEFFKSFHILGK